MTMHRIITMAAALLAISACGNRNQDGSAESVSGPVVTRTVDDIQVSWIKDNAGDRMMPLSLFPDASQELTDSLGLQDGIPSSVGAFLARTDDGLILFDTGMGGKDAGLYSGLDSLGVSAADIDYIYITHCHGDHIGGMMDGDKAVFPNAIVYLSRIEHDAWATPESGHEQAIRTFEAYGDRIRLFDFGDELPGGFKALAAQGHTPGHTVYGRGRLLVVGDIMHGAALQKEHPEISASFDMDAARAAMTRRHFIGYARENGLLMAGMHLPVPGFDDYSSGAAAE